MERLIVALLLFLALAAPMSGTPAGATELGGLPWTAADAVAPDRGVSLFRFGAFGTGIFPHDPLVPNRTVPVRVDGVPLPVISPFGADLERVPALFVDSLTVIDARLVSIATIDSIPLRPQTRIGFLSGDRRRSRFEGLFHRKITDASAILVGGMSDGIRGNEDIPGNSLRLYSVKYIHALTEGSLATATASGFRDRLNLFDLETERPMGDRVMDNIQVSGEVKRYPLSKRTTLTSSAYYRNGVSRLSRNGAGANFDDSAFGLAANLASPRNGGGYSLDFWNDTRLFEGRNTDASWKGNTSGLTGSAIWTRSMLRLDLSAGGMYSSKYGAGLTAAGGLSFPLRGKATGVLRGEFSHIFPGPENIYYPSLLFSDTLRVSDLDRYHTAEVEAGMRSRWGTADVGLSLFTAHSNAPFFVPVPATMVMNGDSRYSGARLTLAARGGTGVYREGDMRIEYIGGSSPRRIWPRPDLNVQARGSLSRVYFKGNLHASIYGDAQLADWRSGPLTPDGVHFFAEGGISLRVSGFTAFYTAENITNTDMRWFDTFRWQGRNYQWGVFWSLRD